MTPSVEIVVPETHVSEPLTLTVESLLEQTSRSFSVTFSSNRSSPASDWVGDAAIRLNASGINARVTQPPWELERIEHWNWCFLECVATWVKPVFAGDLLEPAAIEEMLHAVAAFPNAALVRLGDDTGETKGAATPAGPRFRSADEMRDVILGARYVPARLSALAFKRDALLAVGGIRPMLPITGDRQLHSELAVRYGELQIAKVPSRASSEQPLLVSSPSTLKRAAFRERMTYRAMIAYSAWTEGKAVPRSALLGIMGARLK